MTAPELAEWEETVCLPFYRRGWTDSNTIYLDSQKFYARCAPGGAAEDLNGIYATGCGTAWAGLNLGFISKPVRRVAWLNERLDRALAFYRARAWPWILVMPENWIAPGLHEAVEELLRRLRFQLAMDGQAMSADGLAPLGEPVLKVEPAGWADVAAINAASWNVPVEWVLPLMESSEFQATAKGWVGQVAGQPVSAMVTFPALAYTFCAWGATLPAYRKRGFGDYITRYGAAQAGGKRPVFAISSPQGLKTWLAAGFEKRERFRLYVAPV